MLYTQAIFRLVDFLISLYPSIFLTQQGYSKNKILYSSNGFVKLIEIFVAQELDVDPCTASTINSILYG